MRVISVSLATVATVAFFAARSAADDAKGMAPGHTMVAPAKMEWKDGPSSVPKGAKFVVLAGDPSKAGPFAIRVKLPANFKIAPHFHPADEHLTVIEGSLQMGLGEKWDDKALHELPAGGFGVMEAGTKHFAATKKGCIIQVNGIGPWGTTYVNPEDDPRNVQPKK